MGYPRNFDHGTLAAICSNLQKACEKQLQPENAVWFSLLGSYYAGKAVPIDSTDFSALSSLITQDIDSHYPDVERAAASVGDRGALRCMTWGKKVSAIHRSILARYEKQGDALLESNNLFVCEACGFIAVATQVPELCPICKAPASRFTKVS